MIQLSLSSSHFLNNFAHWLSDKNTEIKEHKNGNKFVTMTYTQPRDLDMYVKGTKDIRVFYRHKII